MRLDGRVAVITGAGSGIGAASAMAMAREGARVIVVDVNEAGAKATVEQIEKAGGQALAVRADVTRAADNQMIVEKALAAWGRLDIFFANAGVPQAPEDVEQVDEAIFDREESAPGRVPDYRVDRRDPAPAWGASLRGVEGSRGDVDEEPGTRGRESRRPRCLHRAGGDRDSDAAHLHG